MSLEKPLLSELFQESIHDEQGLIADVFYPSKDNSGREPSSTDTLKPSPFQHATKNFSHYISFDNYLVKSSEYENKPCPKNVTAKKTGCIPRKKVSKAPTQARMSKPLSCQECGKIFKTANEAQLALMEGCPRCGGTNIGEEETKYDIPEKARRKSWVSKVTVTDQRAFTGKAIPVENKLSREDTGRLGEDLVIAYMKMIEDRKEARPINVKDPSFPLDAMEDHELIEVKAGLVSNTSDAQQWRITIGKLSDKEKEFVNKLSKEEKAEFFREKRLLALHRKEEVLRRLEQKTGEEVKRTTMTLIINPDTKTADIYKFDNWHPRIGWKSELTKKSYVGSIQYNLKGEPVTKVFPAPFVHNKRFNAYLVKSSEYENKPCPKNVTAKKTGCIPKGDEEKSKGTKKDDEKTSLLRSASSYGYFPSKMSKNNYVDYVFDIFMSEYEHRVGDRPPPSEIKATRDFLGDYWEKVRSGEEKEITEESEEEQKLDPSGHPTEEEQPFEEPVILPLSKQVQEVLKNVAEKMEEQVKKDTPLFEKLAKSLSKITGQEITVDGLKEKLEKAFFEAEWTVNFEPDNPESKDSLNRTLADALNDEPRLKNLFEVGRGNGSTNMNDRRVWEKNVFGNSTTLLDDGDRPKYGGIKWEDIGDNEASVYGPRAHFVLHKDFAKERMTLTPSNSSGLDYKSAALATSPLNALVRDIDLVGRQFGLSSTQISELRSSGNVDDLSDYVDYNEIQLWGHIPINKQTIAKIRLHKFFKNRPSYVKIARLADRLGIPVEYFT